MKPRLNYTASCCHKLDNVCRDNQSDKVAGRLVQFKSPLKKIKCWKSKGNMPQYRKYVHIYIVFHHKGSLKHKAGLSTATRENQMK